MKNNITKFSSLMPIDSKCTYTTKERKFKRERFAAAAAAAAAVLKNEGAIKNRRHLLLICRFYALSNQRSL